MLSDEDESPRLSYQLSMLVDANAFGRRTWVQAMVDSAEAGHVQLYWTPTVIEEMARFRQLLWIRKWMLGGGTRMTVQVRRQLLEEAHRWMDYVRPHFSVVEDRPPHVPAWSEPYKAKHDAPIWVAARRVQVDVIVTQNLSAGPPADEAGIQVFENVLYLDPESLPAFLDRWGDICQPGEHIAALTDASGGGASVAEPSGTGEGALAPGLVAFLLDVARRHASDLTASTPEIGAPAIEASVTAPDFAAEAAALLAEQGAAPAARDFAAEAAALLAGQVAEVASAPEPAPAPAPDTSRRLLGQDALDLMFAELADSESDE